jgi:hypothetical protein
MVGVSLPLVKLFPEEDFFVSFKENSHVAFPSKTSRYYLLQPLELDFHTYSTVLYGIYGRGITNLLNVVCIHGPEHIKKSLCEKLAIHYPSQITQNIFHEHQSCTIIKVT